MTVAAVSTKGQVTLPSSMRKKLGIKAHDQVIIEATGDAIVIRRAESFLELKGFLGKALPPGEEKKRMLKAVREHTGGRTR